VGGSTVVGSIALYSRLYFSRTVRRVEDRVAVAAVRVRANSQTRSKSKRNATLAIDDNPGRGSAAGLLEHRLQVRLRGLQSIMVRR
jgi:hypothetical protein